MLGLRVNVQRSTLNSGHFLFSPPTLARVELALVAVLGSDRELGFAWQLLAAVVLGYS